jgi:hypothetical protein
MESVDIGALVTVTGERGDTDGIVFDTPSRSKAVVAVMDAAKGPVFRTVHPRTLSEREAEGPADHALRLLMRRTPSNTKGNPRAGSTGAGHSSPGHTRATAHRATGK